MRFRLNCDFEIFNTKKQMVHVHEYSKVLYNVLHVNDFECHFSLHLATVLNTIIGIKSPGLSFQYEKSA